MTSPMHDQAAGLRDLATFQTSSSARVITIAGGKVSVGKTSAVVNLAMALAKNGKRVLIIDENPCHNNVTANFGLKTHYDLLHVIKRDKTLEQVILHGPANISVLPAMRGIHSLAKLGITEQDWLIKCFSRLTNEIDIVLVDAAVGGTNHVLPLSLASQQVLIVISGSASSITKAYALIKVMSQEYAKRHFLILVNRVESKHDAHAIFDNISTVAQQYLSVSLEFIGYIHNDEKLRRATKLCKPVVEAFPSAPSAACYRQLAENVLFSSCPDSYSGGIENFMQRLIRTSHLDMANLSV